MKKLNLDTLYWIFIIAFVVIVVAGVVLPLFIRISIDMWQWALYGTM